MNKRNTQQRRHLIVSQLQQQGELSVEQLAGQFNTSEVTIRKDLTVLEQAGLLLRRYGGAVPVPQDFVSDSSLEKISKRKLAIAKAAASLIKDHYRIIIDSGRTTAALLPELAAKRGLVVMTNSLAIANTLRELENEPTLLMTGGTWDPQSEAFQGQLAEQMLRNYDFDQLFIGADGIDLARGTTTYNELYSLSRVMAEVAREVIVMLESDKLGRKIHNLELPWAMVKVLITDEGLSLADAKQIEQQGVKVIRVQA
ncbi:DeoR/GlpR family DNA-binding transcription regulator [Rheinheimera sp. EpRS3]|uniref:DeoR/GlpR family DNA-binding transcription regulator n=1 Tax=Rheinheimera sp. EpRS3 TaxID=1712383 RepID=UPI0007497272|nr:DeoR family transcriptional regulator [Rheinheimera sp. EpRS3]KUM52167.1 XRE family transcriptional regulator [Rheinheimera sp. EpRS3]